MLKSKLFAVLAGVALLAAVPACRDHGTGPDAGMPNLDNIWVRTDGATWTFDASYAEYPVAPKRGVAGAEPEPMTLGDFHEDLQHAVSAVPTDYANGTYVATLDGEVETDSGVTAQRMTTRFTPAVQTKTHAPATGVLNSRANFLRLVAGCRPDLRPAIRKVLGPAMTAEWERFGPIIMPGYAFAYEDSGYFGYGDLSRDHSWIYLAGDLEVGTEFSIQLVPQLADDIHLSGRIWSRGPLTVGGRTYRNVVECMYLIDMGESAETDENGEYLGTFHSYVYGTIHFAIGIGPIRCRQRGLLAGSDAYQDSHPLITDYVLDLMSLKYGE